MPDVVAVHETGHRAAFEQAAEDRPLTHREDVERACADHVLPQRDEGPRDHLRPRIRARPRRVRRF